MASSEVLVADDPHRGTPETGSASVVSVRNLVKRFRREDGTQVKAIDDVSLDVGKGEFVVLLGPSGCGKTTLLRTIAGLERPDSGQIEINGAVVFDSAMKVNVSAQRRQLGMIFQSYALWPHMTAFENIAYPLESTLKIPRRQLADRVHRMLAQVGIRELAEQYPNQMSGGQQQRVALGRALVAGNDVILFDEPLSNVDARVREMLRLELVSMQRELGFAAIFVTHDQVEAMELAHHIAVMRDGAVEQFGVPRDVYERPSSGYVARFIGTTNEVVGTVRSVDRRGVRVESPLGEIHGRAGDPATAVGDDVVVVWRPERCRLYGSQPSTVPDVTPNLWEGTVDRSIFRGAHTELHVMVGDHAIRIWSARGDGFAAEAATRVWAGVDPDDVRVLPAPDAPSTHRSRR